MQAQEKVNPQEEAQKIWDQLDAEDSGSATPANLADETLDGGHQDQHASTDVATHSPAPKADELQNNDQPAGDQALLDKIAGLESMLGQVTNRLRNAEGHIGGLNSQLKQQVQTAQQVAAKGGDAPTAGEIRAAQASPEAMSNLKRDYPEFADAMESALNERLGTLEQRLAAQGQQTQTSGVSVDDINRVRAELTVEMRHPGWQDRVQTPEFMGWLQRQPREVQMLAASESPQDAVRLLDLHGDASKAVTSQRTQRLSSAAAIPSGRTGGNVRSKAVEDMSPEEYWRYLDEIDRNKGN